MRPPFLQPGDTIGIAATARKMTPEELLPALDIFKSWGLQVKLAENIFSEAHQYAGSDEERAKGLQLLMEDPGVHAIICSRGGYGSVRIIDRLDFSPLETAPKWIIGYSDITVLHSHLQRHYAMQTLHAIMPFSMQPEKRDEASISALKSALMTDEKIRIEYPTNMLNRKGNAQGILTGGNLSVLYSLLGSDSDTSTEGKILFLEDLDEYLYHIDRMMVNLDRNGKLKGLAGLIVGGMSEMKDNAVPFGKTAEEIILGITAKYDYPVCFGFPAGHEKRNLAMRLGGHAILSVTGDKTVLEID